MDSFRHGPLAKRVAVSAIALYALLLQAFVAAAAPIAAFDWSARITCSEDASRPETPGDPSERHPGLCCILTCADCDYAFVAPAFGIAILPPRTRIDSAIVRALTSAAATRPPLKFYFGARGPPRTS